MPNKLTTAIREILLLPLKKINDVCEKNCRVLEIHSFLLKYLQLKYWRVQYISKTDKFCNKSFLFHKFRGPMSDNCCLTTLVTSKKTTLLITFVKPLLGNGMQGERRWWCLPFAKKSARKAGRKVLCKTAFACKTNQQNLHFYVWGAAAFLGKIVIRVGN